MPAPQMTKFQKEAILTNYIPLPRSLLDGELSSTSLLLYGVLLDRATLSQKNDFCDDSGWVYVIYTIENLSQTLHISDTAVKRHLRDLETHGLIRRQHQARNQPSFIFLSIPSDAIKAPPGSQNVPPGGAKTGGLTGRKVPTNNRRKPQKINELYYQHREDESL